MLSDLQLKIYLEELHVYSYSSVARLTHFPDIIQGLSRGLHIVKELFAVKNSKQGHDLPSVSPQQRYLVASEAPAAVFHGGALRIQL